MHSSVDLPPVRPEGITSPRTAASRPALIDAIVAGKVEELRNLIGAGVDVNAVDREGIAPLHVAAQFHGSTNILIDAGANVNARDMNGVTPLHRAAYTGIESNVRRLIDGGADVNATDKRGETPLHRAAAGSASAEVLQMLLVAGADVNARDGKGNAPIERLRAGAVDAKRRALLESAARRR